MFERIDSADDPRVADYRGVSDPELLRSRNLFIAEGRIVVTRLIEDGRWTIRSVLVSDTARRDLEPTLAAVAARVPIFVCEAADFLGITGPSHPPRMPRARRASAGARRWRGARVAAAWPSCSKASRTPTTSAACFATRRRSAPMLVVLSPTCCSPLYRKAIRTSMGATLRVPFVHLDEWPAPLTRLRAAGFHAWWR